MSPRSSLPIQLRTVLNRCVSSSYLLYSNSALSLCRTGATTSLVAPLFSQARFSLRPILVSKSHRSYIHSSRSPSSSRAALMARVERVADNLEKPTLDDRSYRVIRLPNKLEALLVHDPDTDKASASVNVNVGNFSDDDDLPGLAHAVEHALFMGTEKVSLLIVAQFVVCLPFDSLLLMSRDILVSKRKCVQPISGGPFGIFECIHGRYRNKLLF